MANVNEELVEKYKNDKLIIKTWYTDLQGVSVEGIVNPLKVDNRHKVAPTDDQARYPSCAGYSACTLVESILWKQTGKLVQLDSNQVYARAKQLDGDMKTEGTTLEASLQAVLQLSDFDFLKGVKVEILPNRRNQDTIEATKFLIHKYDFVQVGFQIDEAWYYCNNDSYVIKSGGRALGGHAVMLVGYDSQGVFVANSWGKGWGSKGFGVLPWDLYLKELIYCAYMTGIKY